MSTRARRWIRFVASLMCVLHFGSALGLIAGPGHAWSGQTGSRQMAATDGYACGHVSTAMLVTLAEAVPAVFAEAWRQQTGSGEACCGVCLDCSTAVLRPIAVGLVVEPASHETSRHQLSRGAYRPEVLTPPATAPPVLS